MMNPMQELDNTVMSEIALERFHCQLKSLIFNELSAGEINTLNNYDLVFSPDIPVLERYENAQKEFEKHRHNMSRIIYEQYLEKLIKDTILQIFQERPSLP